MGSESSDARMSVVPAMLAERLGVPQLTFAKEVAVDGQTVRIKRLTDDGYQAVEAALPAVVSVVEKINEPRYPSFKGIMAAKKKPLDTLSLSDLGIEAGEVGLAGAWSSVESFESAPPRQAGTVVGADGGDADELADKLVDFLASKKFV
jgi:electron transfer flavoprotein beta subunit